VIANGGLAERLTARLLRVALPRGLVIFTYHRVLAAADPMLAGEVDAAQFERHMVWLSEHFRVLTLTAAAQALQAGTLPPRSVCITFDDGYASNFSVAAPTLRRYSLPATFFIATSFLDGGRMWNDTVIEATRGTARSSFDLTKFGLGSLSIDPEKRGASADAILRQLLRLPYEQRLACVQEIAAQSAVSLPSGLMMTSKQVRELASSGMDIGGHTVTHPILARTSAAQAQHEIASGRDQLAAITGVPPQAFAYPNGKPGIDFSAEHVAMVRKAGFTTAVTTQFGIARRDADPLQLPRILPWDQRRDRFTLRMIQAARAPYVPVV
jgi:peptidoglycan/xylan/chitin deacetylase (PgdA/CDA1 family)